MIEFPEQNGRRSDLLQGLDSFLETSAIESIALGREDEIGSVTSIPRDATAFAQLGQRNVSAVVLKDDAQSGGTTFGAFHLQTRWRLHPTTLHPGLQFVLQLSQ